MDVKRIFMLSLNEQRVNLALKVSITQKKIVHMFLGEKWNQPVLQSLFM